MTSFLHLMAGALVAMGGPVTGLSIQPAPERTEVVISMDGQAEYRDFTMEGPSRLVVDLLDSQLALPRENFLDLNRGGVRSIRTSQYSASIVRVVIDLERVVGYQILQGDGELRVVLENSGDTFAPWSTVPAAAAPDAVAPTEFAPASAAPVDAALTPTPEVASSPGALFPPQEQGARITVTFSNTPIQEVLFTFAEFADRSIVAGAEVDVVVSAEVRDQPWDVALREILEANGLVAVESVSGIIRVDNLENLQQREQWEAPSTRTFRVSYANAAELQTSVQALLSMERGKVAVDAGTNTVIVTDVKRVLDQVEAMIRSLDRETPQVAIAAKIVFINRTDLQDFGITYDLKDSEGNQLNQITPGAVDQDGNGVIDYPDDLVEVGTDVVALGGNSIAALGNARNRIPNPNLTLLSSLILGRHTLITFIEALESMNLSDIQAHPSVQVLDNQQARIWVGEETPIRVIDAQAGATGGSIPTAQVSTRETGIILEATPHVVGNGKIRLELNAERSAAIPAESDAGYIFTTQNAQSRVLVDDGETVVIAGLTVTETSEVRSGIPLLMDIPIIGSLFRVTRNSTIQRDLMILVTPTIVGGERN
jgi:type IV pilus assembly protein PilQ